jgi:hypothetical protein
MRLNASILLIAGAAAAIGATAYAALPKASVDGPGEPLVNAAGVPAAQAFSGAPSLSYASLSGNISPAGTVSGVSLTGEGEGAQAAGGGQGGTPTTPPTADQLAQLIEAAVNALPAGSTAAQIAAAVNGVLGSSGASADVQAAALLEADSFFASNASVSQALAGVSPVSSTQQANSGYSPFANPQSTGVSGGSFGNSNLPSITVAPVIATSSGTVAEGQPVIS